MKALSVRNPYAELICRGIKDVENRSWTTDYRGRIAIHATRKIGAMPYELPQLDLFRDLKRVVPKTGDNPADWSRCMYLEPDGNGSPVLSIGEWPSRIVAEYAMLRDMISRDEAGQPMLHESAVIGYATILDVVRDSDSEWAERGTYHWLLGNAALLDTPICNVRGKLGLWEVGL